MLANKGLVVMNITCLRIRAKYGHIYQYPKTDFIGVGDEVWLNISNTGELVSISKIGDEKDKTQIPKTKLETHDVDYGSLDHRDSLGSVEVPFGDEVWIINKQNHIGD